MKNKKLLDAGNFENLNDLVVGASVLTSEGKVGVVTKISNIHKFNVDFETMNGDVCECHADISYPRCGSSYMTYRRDGRSHHTPEYDLVQICRPENTKVKSVKIWSNDPISPEMLAVGYELAEQYKLHIDTKTNVTRTKVKEIKGYKVQGRFTKTGMISVKVWK